MKLNKVFIILLIIIFICSFSINCIAVDEEEPLENEQQNQENENNEEEQVEEQEEYEEEEEPQQIYIQPSNNNTVQVKSNNANLSSLVLDVEGLSPEFDKDVTEYYLIVGIEKEEIKVDAAPEAFIQALKETYIIII